MRNTILDNLTESDEILLKKYLLGEQQAFERLYNRHCDALYRFILRQINHTSLTDEIFQDTWSSVIQSASRFRGESKFTTYLYQIARNRIIDTMRKAKSQHVNEHDNEIDNLLTENQPDPESRSQLEKCIELLLKLISQLPSDQKEAFLLKQESDHSLSELALITGTSIETFKSRLRYAMRKLRERMPGDCL